MRARRRLLPWLLALAVVLVAILLATRNAPRLPGDSDHTLYQAEARCLTCHSHTARHPRPAGHPPRDDCFSCHCDLDGKLHPRPGAPTSLPGGWAEDPRLADGRGVGRARPSPGGS